MSLRAEVGRYDVVRMMKDNGEQFMIVLLAAPSYLICFSLTLPIAASSYQEKSRTTTQVFPTRGHAPHGFVSSTPSAVGATGASSALDRAVTWIAVWTTAPRPTSPTANQYGA
jgi:hypothetical protein